MLAGDWTTTAGNDANDGLSPATPKSSIRAVLEAYDLDAGDIIRVDAGTYPLGTNLIITNNDAGVMIEGYHDAAYPTRYTLLDRGNTNSGSYVVELQNADNVTLDHLRITGGYQGIYASNTSDSDHVTVSNSVIYGNYDRGVWLDTGNDFATITANEVYGIPGGTNVDDQYRGIYLAGTDGVVSNNLVHDGYYEGIFVNGLRNQVTGNQVYRFSTGISAYYGGSGADRIIVSGNIAHDNTSTGIYGYQYVLITGNTVYANNSAGISGTTSRSAATPPTPTTTAFLPPAA